MPRSAFAAWGTSQLINSAARHQRCMCVPWWHMKFVSQLECRHRIPILENKSRVRPLPRLESSIVGRESHAAGPEPDEAGRWSILWRAASSAHALALADQLVASGTSFLTTIAVARWTNPGQLGVFVIGMTIMVAALAIQDALVIKPYGIQRFQPDRSPTEHAGNSLMLSGLLAIGSAGALAMCALALLLAGADRETVV